MKKTKEYRELILSMAIGDGHVDKKGYMTILHCETQREYLNWKLNLLKSVGVKASDLTYKSNNGFSAYLISLQTTKFTKLVRRILYKPTKNYFNRRLLNRLSALHIAIWYMDDGGLSQKRRNGKIIANELMLNTHTTKENNQILIDYFNEVWGIKFNQYKNKGWYRLACGTKQARLFLKIVRPFVSQVDCMKHKLNIKSSFYDYHLW